MNERGENNMDDVTPLENWIWPSHDRPGGREKKVTMVGLEKRVWWARAVLSGRMPAATQILCNNKNRR